MSDDTYKEIPDYKSDIEKRKRESVSFSDAILQLHRERHGLEYQLYSERHSTETYLSHLLKEVRKKLQDAR